MMCPHLEWRTDRRSMLRICVQCGKAVDFLEHCLPPDKQRIRKGTNSIPRTFRPEYEIMPEPPKEDA